jgi:hypothetical protein
VFFDTPRHAIVDQFRNAIVGSLFGAVSLFLTNQFISYLTETNIPLWVSWTLVILVSFFLILMVRVYGDNIRSIGPIRKIFYHQAKFEGFWLENVEVDERPYAIASIYYSHKHKAWIYRGTAFDRDMQPAARWKTYSISYDSQSNKWLFRGSCQLISLKGTSFMRAALADDVYVMVTLPDIAVDTVTDMVATDMSTAAGTPSSFRILANKMDGAVLRDESNAIEEIPQHIEQVSFKQAARIIRAHLDQKILPEVMW